MQRAGRQSAIYWALLAASFAVALTASWTFGAQIDNDAYDWMFRLYQPPAWQPESILLAIDEVSLNAYGGVRGLRKPLAEALERIAAVSPKAVAVDVILTDASDPQTDARLAAAMGATRHLVLACQLLPDGSAWEDPLPLFAAHAAALGHVHVEQSEQLDSVGRSLPLEEISGHVRRWALSLEAYRLSRNAAIVESPADLDVGGRLIPASRADRRLMRIRYAPSSMHIPRVSLKDLLSDPGRCRKVEQRSDCMLEPHRELVQYEASATLHEFEEILLIVCPRHGEWTPQEFLCGLAGDLRIYQELPQALHHIAFGVPAFVLGQKPEKALPLVPNGLDDAHEIAVVRSQPFRCLEEVRRLS